MIDLHSHTNESDGTFSPAELIAEASRVGLSALAITDHDTFAGYDQATPHARAANIDLICGIELSTKLHGQSMHLLGYFCNQSTTWKEKLDPFRNWILDLQASRRERNVHLAERLRSLGLDVTLAEAEAHGRGMTGRPHFARVLIAKGFASSIQHAFDEYLAETGKAYVERFEPPFAEGVRRIREAAGTASLAHPVRVKGDLSALMRELRVAGLQALEAFHSDHSAEDTRRFLELAAQHGMLVTGGSDFHGANKPFIELGTGRNGNVRVPPDLLHRMKRTMR